MVTAKLARYTVDRSTNVASPASRVELLAAVFQEQRVCAVSAESDVGKRALQKASWDGEFHCVVGELIGDQGACDSRPSPQGFGDSSLASDPAISATIAFFCSLLQLRRVVATTS